MKALNESNTKSLLGKFRILLFILLVGAACIGLCYSAEDEFEKSSIISDSRILHYSVNPKNADLQFYWKSKSDQRFKNAKGLKNHLDSLGKTLKFCMNGGMFSPKHAPAGLYIENSKKLKEINRVENAVGNFHLVPNGVFIIQKDKRCRVVQTPDYKESEDINFATQSGPMLLIDGDYHPKFNKGSKNLNIRNGVGVLPDGKVLFAMSTERINFYDFATFFKNNGCKNALYLDGAISRTYLPEKKVEQLGGNFGVLIGESTKK